jgi:hypothetical protein
MTTTLRLLPPPALDPPYDDERAPQTPTLDGTLALAFPPEQDALPLRLVPPAAGPLRDDATGRLPDARTWAHRLTQAVVEVLAGARTPSQLSRYATWEVLQHLERAAARLGRWHNHGRPMVSSVHVSHPHDAVIEACAVVDTGPRRRAIAVRLEAVAGGWQCTALQIG